MSKKPKKQEDDDERYDVTAWDTEGNIVKKLWDATYEEAEEIRDYYEDDPTIIVIVDLR